MKDDEDNSVADFLSSDEEEDRSVCRIEEFRESAALRAYCSTRHSDS